MGELVTGFRNRPPERLRSLLLPLAGATAIAVLDVVDRSRSWSTVGAAVLDESAHVLTAWLVWAALASRPLRPGVLPWVLLGAAAIDLDHLPLYVGHAGFLIDGGRPPTHSLTTVAVLAVLALVTRRPRIFGSLALGVLLHFLRDLATGPGVPLAWPLVDASVRVPYLLYAAVVAAATVVAVVRRARPAPSERSTTQ
jgi:inner membrane protein